MTDKTWNELLKQNTEITELKEIQRKKLLDDIIEVVKAAEEEIMFIGSEYHKECTKLTAYENIEELIKDYERSAREQSTTHHTSVMGLHLPCSPSKTPTFCRCDFRSDAS